MAAAAAKPAQAIVTILNGRATVVRALGQFEAAEGVRLQADDLVETAGDSFLRIEYGDGTSLELGPNTLLELNYPSRKRASRPALYLLSGWLKLGSGKPEGARASLAGPGMDLLDLSGIIVIRMSEGSQAIFEEQGTSRWLDRSTRGAEAVSLKAGDFLIDRPDTAPKLQGRPAAEFLAALPRPYHDTLPLRYAKFESRVVLPKSLGAFSYADVERWINSEPSERRQFVVTWRRKADNPAFRTSLDRDLPMHPEWDPVLHPERYEPKEPPAGSSAAKAAEAPAPIRHAEAEPAPRP
jgi:hypothetical protein